jgi:hypothetical protein
MWKALATRLRVGEHDALGPPGRASGVEDRGQILLAERGIPFDLATLRERPLVLVRGEQQIIDSGDELTGPVAESDRSVAFPPLPAIMLRV